MQESVAFIGTLKELTEMIIRKSMCGLLLQAKENGLSMSQISALIRIRNRASRNVSEVGDALNVSNAAASQLIDRLVQQGLIIRLEDPNDRRVKPIELTEKGRLLIHAGMDSRHLWLEGLAEQLTPAEQEQINAAMTLLIDKIRQLDPADECVECEPSR